MATSWRKESPLRGPPLPGWSERAERSPDPRGGSGGVRAASNRAAGLGSPDQRQDRPPEPTDLLQFRTRRNDELRDADLLVVEERHGECLVRPDEGGPDGSIVLRQ